MAFGFNLTNTTIEEVTLYGLETLEETLRIRVDSNGETAEDSIRIDVFEAGMDPNAPLRIVIYRIKEDNGKMNVPDGVWLSFPFSTLTTQEGRTMKSGDSLILENIFHSV